MPGLLPNGSFQTDFQQFLRLYGKLHRELFEDTFAESVDDHVHGVFRIESTLLEIE